MGVMACRRKSCDNIMCDTCIDMSYYICNGCQREFKEYVEKNGLILLNEDDILNELEIFMVTKKGTQGEGRRLFFRKIHPMKKALSIGNKVETIVPLYAIADNFGYVEDVGEVYSHVKLDIDGHQDEMSKGEQISFRDLWDTDTFKVIHVNEEHETLLGTDGEHHIMTATLLK